MAARDALLDVAARLYAEHGWRGTTTRKIAEVAGVNEVTVFRQFGSKQNLLLEAIQHASTGPAIGRLPEVPGDLGSELTAWALAQHRGIAAKRGIIRACLAESEERPELAPAVCEPGRIAHVDLVRYLKAARAQGLVGTEGSIDAAAVLLINAVFMDAITRDLVPGSSTRPADPVVGSFVDMVLRGLGARTGA